MGARTDGQRAGAGSAGGIFDPASDLSSSLLAAQRMAAALGAEFGDGAMDGTVEGRGVGEAADELDEFVHASEVRDTVQTAQLPWTGPAGQPSAPDSPRAGR